MLDLSANHRDAGSLSEPRGDRSKAANVRLERVARIHRHHGASESTTSPVRSGRSRRANSLASHAIALSGLAETCGFVFCRLFSLQLVQVSHTKVCRSAG